MHCTSLANIVASPSKASAFLTGHHDLNVLSFLSSVRSRPDREKDSRWKGGIGRRFLQLQEMDVIKEFLESSTIHGISHISTSKVILRNGLSQNNVPFIDWLRQAFLDWCCYIWIYGSFCADQQLLFRMANIPNSHDHHHPPAEEPQLPERDDLPPKGVQHCALPRSHEGG